ncbi:MAG TPA: hypothetical protein VJQ56_10500 [Blastocatellia bacterium]|nr:hypothetical protein [Blastocatellia bacterium]
MRLANSPLLRTLGLCAFAFLIGGTSAYAQEQQPTEQQKSQQPAKPVQISEGERQALKKIQDAADLAAKLQAAGEYVKKYPKSSKRGEVVGYLAGEIAKVTDSAQQTAHAEGFLAVFTEPAEAGMMTPFLIDAYIKAKRIDDAFRLATSHLEKNPGDVQMLTQMSLIGVDQIKAQNPKFIQQSQQFGLKAIELIEADRRPEAMDVARWGEYKTRWLPQLYQSMGLVAIVTQKPDEAKARLEKAAAINANDAVTFLYLGSLLNQEYQQLAEQHKSAGPGPMKDEMLKQAQAKMDEVIQIYARVVALSEGNPQLQRVSEQVMQDLTAYYKYRHNGSTDGLQEVIAKYKKQ